MRFKTFEEIMEGLKVVKAGQEEARRNTAKVLEVELGGVDHD